MTAPEVYVVHYNGYDVECYGTLGDDSNFNIVCEDEADDDVWYESNPDRDAFTTWEDVVSTLQHYFNSPILEISAC